MRANQLRLWFASLAYVLLCALRRIGLAHTHFATATCGTLRLKLLKIGARVKTSVRRIKVALDSAYPRQAEWALAQDRKSTRLNSSHVAISYAVFCLKKQRSTRNAPL